ncbi:MAG: arsenate reductase (glutaredoxin) [Beijerinckiaceae bacterium]|nr:MAG: arsenate reductase (glutaredoxin) [Beijerinckiaceae bacterium]
MSVTIFHNPACSTSRKVLELLREAGIEPKIVLYLNDPPSRKELATLLGQMKMTPRELLRKRGTPYEELGLGDMSLSDAALIDAMVTHPILIERPIVISDKGAVLCRPAERVYEVLPDKQATVRQ